MSLINALNTKKEPTIDLKHFDEFLQNALDKFIYTELESKVIDNIGDASELIFDKESLIPDLILQNKIFNKNDCFYDYEGFGFNKFPRQKFIFSTEKEKVKNENILNEVNPTEEKTKKIKKKKKKDTKANLTNVEESNTTNENNENSALENADLKSEMGRCRES